MSCFTISALILTAWTNYTHPTTGEYGLGVISPCGISVGAVRREDDMRFEIAGRKQIKAFGAVNVWARTGVEIDPDSVQTQTNHNINTKVVDGSKAPQWTQIQSIPMASRWRYRPLAGLGATISLTHRLALEPVLDTLEEGRVTLSLRYGL